MTCGADTAMVHEVKEVPTLSKWRELPTWWIKYSHRGEVHRESTRTREWKQAEKFLEQRKAEILQGTFSGPGLSAFASRSCFARLQGERAVLWRFRRTDRPSSSATVLRQNARS